MYVLQRIANNYTNIHKLLFNINDLVYFKYNLKNILTEVGIQKHTATEVKSKYKQFCTLSGMGMGMELYCTTTSNLKAKINQLIEKKN